LLREPRGLSKQEDVSNVLIRLEEPAKFIAVDEQSNHQIVHPLCF
jgi:hypothetical protein